jgi:hypothetical protein
MNHLADQYQFWIEKLGWVTPEMLCVLTRGVSRVQLPEGRDRTLERFLHSAMRDGKLAIRSFRGRRAYGFVQRRAVRTTSAYHDLMAAQVAVRLWIAFNGAERLLFNPRDFFSQGCPLVPDFGLVVSPANGAHAFALEYQTFRQSVRTTESKLVDYSRNFETLRAAMSADYLWLVMVLEREPSWVEEFARSISSSFAYCISAQTLFETEALATAPVFFRQGGDRVSLVDLL